VIFLGGCGAKIRPTIFLKKKHWLGIVSLFQCLLLQEITSWKRDLIKF
jgi:hypothetical protein